MSKLDPESLVNSPIAVPDPPPGPIAYVVKMFPRLSETFITNEILELRRRGVDVRIVSLLPPIGNVQSDEAVSLRSETFIIPWPGRPGAGPGRVINDHGFAARRAPRRYTRTILQVARRFSFSAWKRFAQAGPVARFCIENDVRHLHAGFAHVPTSVAWWVSRLTGIPFSFAAHAKDLYLSDPKSLRNKMDAARFVWTCTEANGEHLRSLGSHTPVHVGYHGCDLTLLVPRSLEVADESVAAESAFERRIPRILGVGRLVPKKGFDDLIRACALIRDHGKAFEVEIIGDGPERERIESLTEELGLAGIVRLRGSLLPSQVHQAYATSDLVVLPSVVLENGDRDGIPNVLVEAMAMGVPVVSTSVSAIPELIKDGERGRLVPPRTPESLAAAIEETLGDRPAALERAARARSFVAERFDLHRNSQRLAELLERHRRPTRCLYITADFGVPVRGHKGASAHVRQVVARMAEAGLDVRVMTPAPGPEPPAGNAFPFPIIEVCPEGWLSSAIGRLAGARLKGWAKELRRVLYNLNMARAVRGLIHELHPDFVYERYSLCAIATGAVCRRRGIPWLVEVNAPLADEEVRYRSLRMRWLTRRMERWVLRHADHLFVVSHVLRRWAMEMGVHPDRVSVLPNGVDRTRFHPGVDGTDARNAWGWTGGETVIGFAGSLKPWHGGMLLLEAFEQAHARDLNLRFVLIGDGPEKKLIEKRVRKHGLEGLVHFTGAVSQDQVPGLLRGCDLLAAPYLPQEHFYFSPLKILEYLAVGRPVIASRIGEIPDLLDERHGRLVAPGDRRSFRDAILELARDASLRAELGLAAAIRGERHDWSQRVGTILQIVQGLRAVRRQPARRVGYVLKMFPRFSETFITNEITELEHQRVEIRVFSMKAPTGHRQEETVGVRARVTILPDRRSFIAPRVVLAHLRCLGRSPGRYVTTLVFAITRWDLRAIAKFAQAGLVADTSVREHVGHLHSHFASGPTRVAKMAAMMTGLPFSFTAHAKDLYWAGHRHEESHKLKKRTKLARFIVTVSRENERFLDALPFRIKEGKIRTLYIGLRLPEFRFTLPSGRPKSPRPLIMGVGRLIEKKGFHILIEALTLLKARGVGFRCVLAGDGPERRRLEALARERGIEGCVRFLGAVPLGRLRRSYYSRARVLAQPCVVAADGDRDGIPTVLLEAMAMGVPVVSTRVSGIPEAIDDGVDGYLAEPGDVVSLADRIEALLGDARLADRIAVAGRSRVERQFDLKKNAGSLRKLFTRSIMGWPPVVGVDEEATDRLAEDQHMAVPSVVHRGSEAADWAQAQSTDDRPIGDRPAAGEPAEAPV